MLRDIHDVSRLVDRTIRLNDIGSLRGSILGLAVRIGGGLDSRRLILLRNILQKLGVICCPHCFVDTKPTSLCVVDRLGLFALVLAMKLTLRAVLAEMVFPKISESDL